MRVLFFIFCSFLVCAELAADPPEARCYIGEETAYFANPPCFEADASIEGKIPEIIYDKTNPTGLRWVPQAKGVTVEGGKIGELWGQAIYEFVYHAKTGNEDGITGPLCVLCAYQSRDARNPSSLHLRPFFLLMGDESIDSAGSDPTLDKRRPPSLRIYEAIKGTGMYSTSYLFGFAPKQVWLKERTESGRKMHTKIYSYNRRGKLIATKVESSE